MANNGIYYSSGNSLNFTTNSTTWATLGSGGTFVIDTVSGGTYLNLPSSTFTGGTVNGPTIFTSGLTANTISAATYYNLPVSGITAGTGIGVSNSNGNYTISYTGSTGTSGAYLPLSGGTVTGGTIFTSGVTANTLSNVNYILFNTTATTTHTEGQIHWNDDTKTLEIDTDKTGVTYETGQNTLVRVTNKTGAPLTAGTVVYINGAQAGRPTVTKATYEQDATSARSLGFITQTINDNNQGYVTTNGLLRNVNTNSYTAGTQLYLYTGGTITNVRPVAPLHEVRLGYVVTQGSADGVIYVYIQNGYEFTELHDVQISGQTNNDIPYWNSTLGVWKNTNSPVFTSLTATTISAATYQNLPYSGTVVGTGTTNYVPVWTGSTGIGNSIIRANSTNVSINTSIDSNVLLSLYTTGSTGVQSQSNDYGVIGTVQASTGFGVYGSNNSGGGGGAGVYGAMSNGTGVYGNSTGDGGSNIGVRGIAEGSGNSPINIGGYFSSSNVGTNYSVQLTDGTEDVGKVLVSQTADGKANWSGELNITGVTATTISAATYLNLPYTGQTNFIPKWTNTTGLTDSQIYDDGTQVYIGTQVLSSLFSVGGTIGVNEFQIQAIAGSLGITDQDLTSWTTGGAEIAIGGLGPLAGSIGSGNVAIGYQSMINNVTGVDNVAVGRRSLISNQAGQANVAIGYRAGGNVGSGSYNVFIGYDAGEDVTTEDNRLYIANNTYGTLIYGEFDNQIVNIGGTLSATTYDNLPGSSAGNCFTTFYVTNISGCSPVNMLSPLNVQDGLSVTGTSTFTSQANFTGGISASTFSASTYQNLPTDVFVSAGTYSNGQITFTNTTGGTFNVNNIPIGGAGGQPYYLNLSVSQTPYREFATSATTAAEQTTGVTIASGVTTTIANFLTPTGYPNTTLIPAGIWSFYLHSYKANSSTNFDIFVEVYKRTTGGTETLLLSTDPTDVNSIGVASMEISDTYYSGTSLNTSDRILVKVRATNTGTASSTITFLTEGTDHYSYGVTPFTNTGNVLGVTATDGLSGNSTTGAITIINTDKGSSQNIFKNIQVNGVTQFSAGSNSSNLNFSGINITITSAATNTLVFSAGTGGGGGVTSVTAGSGLSGNSTTGAITLINTQVQGITGITASSGISASTSNNVVTLINTGVTGITAGSNISIDQSTGNVTISSTGGGAALGTVYTTANNFNFL